MAALIPVSLRNVAVLTTACSALVASVPAQPTIGSQSHTAALIAPPARRGGEVRIVAQGGGGDFTSIQSAVNAAAPGDTILVKSSGNYGSFTLNGKAVNVVEDAGASVDASFTILNIPEESVAVVIGMRGYFFTLADNAGRIRLESCSLRPGFVEHGPSLVASNCADVSISRSQLVGSAGDLQAGPSYLNGADTISASSSVLTLYQTTSIGGQGGNAYNAGNGGRGLFQSSSFSFAAGCTIKGGSGGNSTGQCEEDSSAGNGARALTGSVSSIGLGSALMGGQGGFGCPFNGQNGAASAFTMTLPGTAREMSLATPVRDRTVVPISFTGAPGDFVTLFISRSTNHVYDADLNGVLVVESPYFAILHMGVVPPSGVLNSTLRIDDSWTSDYTASLYFMQAVFNDTSGGSTLSNPTSLVVLDHVY